MENATILGKCGICLHRVKKTMLKTITVPTVSIEDSDVTEIKIKMVDMDICPGCGKNLALKIFEAQSHAIEPFY